MTKRCIKGAFMTVLLIMLTAPARSVAGTNKQSKLTMVGPVVAYEISATRLAQLTFVPNTEIVIVRVDKLVKGREQARYLKVVYKYGTDEPSLAREVFDGKNNGALR